jgi:hypothetical protein
MVSGQTQLVYTDEEALSPRSIEDVKQMLDRSELGSQIRHYKIVSGIMFFEVTRTQYNVKRRGFTSYVRYHLVTGEDPMEKGCLVSMHLSPEAQYLITLHMSTLWDTRGGIVNVAWCTAFQFKRRILSSGNDSRSYWAIRKARRNYCKALLRLLDDSLDLENQDWQAIQVCAGSHTTLYLANKYQKEIDDHKKLFEECKHYRHRNRSVEPGADDDDDQDDDPGHDFDQRRLAAGPGEDDELADHNGQDWRTRLNRLRRDRQLDPEPENDDEDAPDDDPDRFEIEEITSAGFGMQAAIDEDLDMEDNLDEDRFDYPDDRSSSPFIPHSRQTSPETIRHPNDIGNLSEIDIDDFSGIKNNRTVNTRSSTRLDSLEVKLEPKVEPEEEAMAQIQYRFTRPIRTHDLIDLTEDTDDSTRGGTSILEMIDLIEDPEPSENSNRYEIAIDLNQDSEEETSQSTMQVIELDD